AWLLVAAAVVAAGVVAARWVRALGAGRLARRLEADGSWRAGALSTLLESPASGTSGHLLDAADRQRAREVDERGAAAVATLAARLARSGAAGALAAAVGALLLVTSGGRGLRALLRPAEAWAVLAAPLSLDADRNRIEAGGSVTLAIRAPGRARVRLWTRAPGTTWSSRVVELDSAGRAAERLGPLEAALFAHVTDGRRSSDTVEVTLIHPTLLAALSLRLRYPRYLGLEDEPVAPGPDTVLVPAGTRVEASGEATAPLARAAWVAGARRQMLDTDGARFRGSFSPAAAARWDLALEDRDGRTLAGEPVSLVLRVVSDEAPVVEVPMPAGDTQAVAGAEVGIVIDARDDHGLRDLVLERRLARRGATRPLPDQPLALPGREPDHAILPTAIDPTAVGLQPGDTLRLVVRARDNAPAPQTGRSRVVAIVMPTRDQAREEGRQQSEAIARQLDSLVAESRRAQRQAEDLGRSRERTAEEALQFEAAKRAEAVAERQQDLLREAEEVRKALDELQRNAERAGVADSAFLKSLEAVREELERALTPELRRRLEELREALKSLDRERTTEAVRRMADAQEKLREALERSRDLFKRAALEGELASLAQEAKELSEREQAWSDSVARADSAQAAREERGLSAQADSLAAGLLRATRRLEGERSAEGLRRSADSARSAANEMRNAARDMERGQRQNAAQRGRRAAQQLGQVQQDVQEQRSAQQQAWRQEVIDALDRALLETTRLAERQLALAGRFQRGNGLAQARGEQGALEEGAQKLLEQVLSAGGRNALVSPQIAAALAEARQQMRKAREAAASAGGSLREATDAAGEAVDALNVAAFGLLRSREDVAGSGSGSGFQEALERMARLAQQQGQLSQDATGLLPMVGAPSIQQQLQALAARQRAMARELDRLRAQGQQDVKPLADEARELARSLEAGRLDRETVARQERLFRRMLDAGRTLQGREEDEQKERQSETAKPGTIRIPPSLAEQLRGRGREIRLPTWDELVRLSPEERRLVTDYFRRLAGGTP
ncbi:MAG: hypothetical protein ACRENB_15400, partial [Gemmatimonadales bacterium]